jgi:hypothetical protein
MTSLKAILHQKKIKGATFKCLLLECALADDYEIEATGEETKVDTISLPVSSE